MQRLIPACQLVSVLPLGLAGTDRRQPHFGTGQTLGQRSAGDGSEGSQAWVAAYCLTIIHQYDRLTIRWNLHCPQGNALGNNAGERAMQGRAGQSYAHTIGAIIHCPGLVESLEKGAAAEGGDLRAEHDG